MKRIASNAMVIAIAVVLPFSAANAQRGQRGFREGMGRAGVENVLRMRERLELTDEQLTQLEELRVTALERRKTRMAEMMDLQSRRRSGDLEREEWRDVMAERRETNRTQGVQQREQITAILTDEQRDGITSLRSRRVGSRRGARAGRFWNDRGAARGFRGRERSRRFAGPRRVDRFRGRVRAGEGRWFRRGPIR